MVLSVTACVKYGPPAWPVHGESMVRQRGPSMAKVWSASVARPWRKYGPPAWPAMAKVWSASVARPWRKYGPPAWPVHGESMVRQRGPSMAKVWSASVARPWRKYGPPAWPVHGESSPCFRWNIERFHVTFQNILVSVTTDRLPSCSSTMKTAFRILLFSLSV